MHAQSQMQSEMQAQMQAQMQSEMQARMQAEMQAQAQAQAQMQSEMPSQMQALASPWFGTPSATPMPGTVSHTVRLPGPVREYRGPRAGRSSDV